MQEPKTSSEPYVSFVTFARNDDYAGGPRKLYWSTRYLAEQCDEADLAAEAVIVEWNPPSDREPLALMLRELPASRNLVVRIITVPAGVHRRFAHAHARPMHGALAANVGLRRARGRFLLVKVADAFYPDSLIAFLAARGLDTNRLYRAMRADVTPHVEDMLGRPRADFLASCVGNVLVRNEPLPQQWMPFRLPDLFTNACGDFQLLARERWHELRGYWESSDVLGFETDSMFSYSAYAAGIREELIPSAGPVYKITHAKSHGHRLVVRNSWFSWTMQAIEAALGRLGMRNAPTFWMRAFLNYPAKIYGGIRKPVYERSLIRFKLLSVCPRLTRLKGTDWGLASEPLSEQLLTDHPGNRRQSATSGT